MDRDCIFCKISNNEVPSYTVWNSDDHVAFLTPFPNTPGVTVVIPRKHITSYVFDAENNDICKLMLAAKSVASMLDNNLDDVGRCGLVFEGFGVNHLHAKLYPMHGTSDMKKWSPIEKKLTDFYDVYPGYISSHDGREMDQAQLEKLAKKIRGEDN